MSAKILTLLGLLIGFYYLGCSDPAASSKKQSPNLNNNNNGNPSSSKKGKSKKEEQDNTSESTKEQKEGDESVSSLESKINPLPKYFCVDYAVEDLQGFFTDSLPKELASESIYLNYGHIFNWSTSKFVSFKSEECEKDKCSLICMPTSTGESDLKFASKYYCRDAGKEESELGFMLGGLPEKLSLKKINLTLNATFDPGSKLITSTEQESCSSSNSKFTKNNKCRFRCSYVRRPEDSSKLVESNNLPGFPFGNNFLDNEINNTNETPSWATDLGDQTDTPSWQKENDLPSWGKTDAADYKKQGLTPNKLISGKDQPWSSQLLTDSSFDTTDSSFTGSKKADGEEGGADSGITDTSNLDPELYDCVVNNGIPYYRSCKKLPDDTKNCKNWKICKSGLCKDDSFCQEPADTSLLGKAICKSTTLRVKCIAAYEGVCKIHESRKCNCVGAGSCQASPSNGPCPDGQKCLKWETVPFDVPEEDISGTVQSCAQCG